MWFHSYFLKFPRLFEQFSFFLSFQLFCPVPSNVNNFMSHVMFRKKNEARSWIWMIFVFVPQLAIIITMFKQKRECPSWFFSHVLNDASTTSSSFFPEILLSSDNSYIRYALEVKIGLRFLKSRRERKIHWLRMLTRWKRLE